MDVETWWAITLGLGLVVAVVAVMLLQLLLRQVRRIERAATEVWTTGKAVAGNTATGWMLDDLSKRLGDLAEEATAQHQRVTAGGD